MSETFNYTLASSLLSATNFTGSNLSISSNISAANISLSGNLSVSGTLNTVNMTTTNLIDTNVSAGNANISNMTIGNVKVTSNLNAAGNSNTIGSLFTTGGNVGIGTGTPRSTLEVYGNARIVNNLLINTAANNNLGINLPVGGYGIHWGNGYSRIYDDVDLRICTDNTMHFYTGSTTSSPGTERITLTPGGNVGIGTNAPNYTLAVNGPAQFGNNTMNNKIIVLYDGNSGDNWTTGTSFYGFGINNGTLRYQVLSTGDYHRFYFGSNLRAQIGGTGQSATVLPAYDGTYKSDWPAGWDGGLATFDITCSGIAAGGFLQRSDIRKKQDITDYTRGLNEILQMRPVSFTWKANPEYGTQYGFIAQEMEQIISEIVNEDTAGFKSIANAFNPIFANAIQELKQKLDSVRAKIAQLNNKKTL
jgi:hypothetical protein